MSGQKTARTIIATMNRIDRVTKRATRERERKGRAAQRAKKPEVTPEAVTRQDALIERLTRAHLQGARGGDSEQQPVLYVKLAHAAMSRMDLRKLEPVSTCTVLGSRLDWESARAFAPIGIDDLKLFVEQPRVQTVAS